ncbi:unnamed protein product, partial [Prorocentrum cordatum]
AQPPAAGGLAGAREAFQAARALSEQSRFREAEPLLRAALRAMGGAEQAAVPPQARAEVWAHLGIARQSLDDVSGAVDAYTAAVELDPSLHVCLANLATLHAFRDEKEQALGFIDRKGGNGTSSSRGCAAKSCRRHPTLATRASRTTTRSTYKANNELRVGAARH